MSERHERRKKVERQKEGNKERKMKVQRQKQERKNGK